METHKIYTTAGNQRNKFKRTVHKQYSKLIRGYFISLTVQNTIQNKSVKSWILTLSALWGVCR